MLQATIIGVVAGVALNAILSMVVVQGGGFDTPQDAPKTCKKRVPAKDAGVLPDHPAMSGLTWRIDRSSVGS
jgi:hypothetical protein